MSCVIFSGEQLGELLAPLESRWKACTKLELVLMEDLVPLLKRLAQGSDIIGVGCV